MICKRPLTLSFINILLDENNSSKADVIKLWAQNNTHHTVINMYFHITTKWLATNLKDELNYGYYLLLLLYKMLKPKVGTHICPFDISKQYSAD